MSENPVFLSSSCYIDRKYVIVGKKIFPKAQMLIINLDFPTPLIRDNA